MTTTVVNLNKARKARAKATAKVQAAENRVRSGRTKTERQFDAAREALRRREDEGRRLPSD